MTEFNDLLSGYQRFKTADYEQERERWEELGRGQSPKVMIIACSDSRVDPTQIFDAGPGEMFVVRNVANLVPPFEADGGRHGVSAALEFAVTQLEVSDILVLGHASCGGVGASLSKKFADKQPGEGGFIANWVDILDEPRDRIVAEHGTGPDAVKALELETVRTSIANLRTFPFVAEREGAGKLRLRGAYFAIADGVLQVLGDDGEFAPAQKATA